MNQISPDEVFDNFNDRDSTTDVVGYVEEVRAPAEVGKKKKYKLFKFTLSNGQKKVVCLVWGDVLINRFQPLICINHIIHIESGFCKAVHLNYQMEHNDIVPFELILQDQTTVTSLGPYARVQSLPEPTILSNFPALARASGYCSIQGYLKTKMVTATERNTSNRYVVGSITDGHYKLIVHVTSRFQEVLNILQGTCITVRGQLSNDDLPVIVCESSMDIQVHNDSPPMPIERLRLGVRNPKRAAPAPREEPPAAVPRIIGGGALEAAHPEEHVGEQDGGEQHCVPNSGNQHDDSVEEQ